MSEAVTDADLARAAGLLRGARRVAVLTGAGVSAESGVPTFRGMGGLWEGHAVEEVASPGGFRRDPGLVWRFYNARRAGLRTVSPNPGHHALVALEERLPGRFTLVTQNVDGLHVAAGSRNVVELHGNLRRVKCSREECAYRGDRGLDELPDAPKCPACSGLLRPDIVWFGEMLDPENWQSAVEAVATCDVLLVVGTSRQVHPAASLVPAARMVDAVVVEVNPDPRPEGGDDILYLRGPSGVVLPRLVAMSAPE